MQRPGERVLGPGNSRHKSLTRGPAWCGEGTVKSVMGATEQGAYAAVGAQSAGHCPKQPYGSCSMGLEPGRKHFPVGQEELLDRDDRVK